MADLDVLKDIPGYKAILKSVIKTQIQLLVEQLSDHTGEESIILTASVNDGSLSHLGSCTGKGFLEGRDEIKSQFLGYCLKSHHRKRTQEVAKSPFEHSSGPPMHSTPKLPIPRLPVHQPPAAKRPRILPSPMPRISAPSPRGSPLSAGVSDQTFRDNRIIPLATEHGTITNTNGERIGKVEPPGDSQGVDSSFSDNVTSTPTSFPSTLQLSHTQTSAGVAADSDQSVPQTDDNKETSGDAESSKGSVTNVKIEPITEGDMELEITGVELGDSSQGPEDSWDQDLPPGIQMYGTPGAEGGDGLDASTDQSGYNWSTGLEPCHSIPDEMANSELDERTMASMIDATRNAVGIAMSEGLKRRRGEYEKYSQEEKTAMIDYCLENGVARTAEYFTEEFGRRVCRSTVRSIRDKYLELTVGKPIKKSPGRPKMAKKHWKTNEDQ